MNLRTRRFLKLDSVRELVLTTISVASGPVTHVKHYTRRESARLPGALSPGICSSGGSLVSARCRRRGLDRVGLYCGTHDLPDILRCEELWDGDGPDDGADEAVGLLLIVA